MSPLSLSSRFVVRLRPAIVAAFALAFAFAALLLGGCANNAADSADNAPAAENAAAPGAADDAAMALKIEGPDEETPVLTGWSFTGPASSTTVALTYDERGNLVEQTMTHSESSFESTNTTTETYESDVPATLALTDVLPAGTTETLYAFDAPTLATDAGASTLTETALPDAGNDYPTALQYEYTLTDDLAQLTRTVESSILLSGQKADTAADIQIAPDNTVAQTYDYNADGTLPTYTVEAYGERGVTECAYDGDRLTATGEFAGEWTLTRDAAGRIVGASNDALGATMSFTYEMKRGLTAVNHAIALTRPAYALAQGLLEAAPPAGDAEAPADAA